MSLNQYHPTATMNATAAALAPKDTAGASQGVLLSKKMPNKGCNAKKQNAQKQNAGITLQQVRDAVLSDEKSASSDESHSTGACSKEGDEWQLSTLENLKRDYAEEIDAYVRDIEAKSDLSRCLKNHAIEPAHRAKMLDWMVEVLACFRCSDQTFFLAVNIMDRYFKASPRALPITELHLTGLVAMFLASKYEDIMPFSLRTVYEKIGHKKFSEEAIMQKEIEILQALDFNLMRSTTILEHIERMAEEHLKGDFQNLSKFYNFFGRLVVFDYKMLNSFTSAELAVSALWTAVEALEKRKGRRIRCKALLARLTEMCGVGSEKVAECSEAIKELKRSFAKKYRNMENLNRFFSVDADAMSD